MKIAFVRWIDASYHEGGGVVDTALSELYEVGFLLSETDESVTLGMEEVADPTTDTPGRWRVSIPKVNIREMHIKELGKAFPLRSTKKVARPAKAVV